MDKQVRFNSAFRGVHAPARLHDSDEMAASPTCGRCGGEGGNSSNAWIPIARVRASGGGCSGGPCKPGVTFDNCGLSQSTKPFLRSESSDIL